MRRGWFDVSEMCVFHVFLACSVTFFATVIDSAFQNSLVHQCLCGRRNPGRSCRFVLLVRAWPDACTHGTLESRVQATMYNVSSGCAVCGTQWH